MPGSSHVYHSDAQCGPSNRTTFLAITAAGTFHKVCDAGFGKVNLETGGNARPPEPDTGVRGGCGGLGALEIPKLSTGESSGKRLWLRARGTQSR